MKPEHAEWMAIWETIDAPDRTDPELARHLSECSRCARRLTEARRLLELLAAARLPHPPRHMIARAQARMSEALASAGLAHEARPKDAALDSWREWLARATDCWAQLVGDSWRPAAHLRGAQVASPRMLRYEAGEYAVVLSLTGAGQRIELAGQVSPRRSSTLPAVKRILADMGGETIDAEISALGEFRFTALTGEPRELIVLMEGTRIRLRLPSPEA